MKYVEATTQYLQSLLHEAKCASSTHKKYKCGLNRYGRFLTAQGYEEPELSVALDLALLRRFQMSLSSAGLRPRTIHGQMDPLQSLCAWLVVQGVMASDPTKNLVLPKRDSANRERVSDEEVIALLDGTEKQLSDIKAAQSKAIIAMYCFTGLRCDEMVKATVRDVRLDFNPPKLFVVHGKGSKSREITLSEECVDALKHWLAAREKMKCTHDRLWSSSPMRFVSTDWLRAEVERVKAAAGLKGKSNIKPHSLRHWFATNMMRNGATLKQIQVALGHASLKTTIVYLGIDDRDIEAIATKTVLRRPQKPVELPMPVEAPAAMPEAAPELTATRPGEGQPRRGRAQKMSWALIQRQASRSRTRVAR